MHILLTRPLDDCKELILRFKSLGHKVSHLPVIIVDAIKYNKVDRRTKGGWVPLQQSAEKKQKKLPTR